MRDVRASSILVILSYFLSNCAELLLCHKLNDVILYYEPVVYEGIPLAQVDEGGQKLLTFRFHAFARSFDLELTANSDLLAANALIEVLEGNSTQFLSSRQLRQFLVQGRLSGDRSSFAQGDIQLGLFDGIITTQDEQYFVEPSSTYFSKPMPFSSIIFRRSDINYTAATCTSDGLCQPFILSDTMAFNDTEYLGMNFTSTRKLKRNANSVSNSSKVQKQDVVCTLKIVADHTFHAKIGGGNTDRTIYEMMVLLAEADKIFRSANLLSETDTVGLQVASIVIWTHASQKDYRLASESMTATSFLSKFSEYDMSDYCLGIAFVHRKFPSSVLGLAYSASPRESVAGGICQRFRISSHKKSYNVMVASVQGMASRLPRATSIVTLSHELGHSFGSGHDPEEVPECFPNDQQGGHYLMSAFAVSGEKPNHLHFSPCSEDSIRKLVNAKGKCLKPRPPTETLCGNALRDSLDEECDCGEQRQCESVDKCCVPKGGMDGEKECSLRRLAGVVCSPRSDPCCTENCQHVRAKTMCHKETECTELSWCTEDSSRCPEPRPKPDGTMCRQGQGKCRSGVCEDTWCWGYNLQDCECTDSNLWCVVCCSIQGICASSSHFGLVNETSGGDLMHDDGEPCGEARGVCYQQKCRMVLSRTNKCVDPLTYLQTSSYCSGAITGNAKRKWYGPQPKQEKASQLYWREMRRRKLIILEIFPAPDGPTSSVAKDVELSNNQSKESGVSKHDGSVMASLRNSWKSLIIFHAVLLTSMMLILVLWSFIPLSAWLRTPPVLPRLPAAATSFLVIRPEDKTESKENFQEGDLDTNAKPKNQHGF